MKEKSEKISYEEFLRQIYKLYQNSDYVTIINEAKKYDVDYLVYSSEFLSFYSEHVEYIVPNINIFIVVGIAYYRLNKFEKSLEYFKACENIFKNIEIIINAFSKCKKLSEKEEWQYAALKDIRKQNSFLIPIIHSYIAQLYFKMHNPIFSALNYRKAYQTSALLNLENNPEHRSIYIDILLGRSDSYYELTKIYITTFKILFFIAVAICTIIFTKDEILFIITSLYNKFNPYILTFCLLLIILTFPKVFYKIFYFLLRRVRRFIAVNFIDLFPEPFLQDRLINFLNIINLKEFLSFKTHKQAIEKIELLAEKNFNTFFAIAKLYYCLGDYKNSTFYIQRALNNHEKSNESELAMAYHYLARISYKTSNHSTAIDFYNKSIDNLMSVNNHDTDYKIEYLPSISDMIKYTQENRNKIEQTMFSRTYFPLFVTLIITIIVCLMQIYYSIEKNHNRANVLFVKTHNYYNKLFIKNTQKNMMDTIESFKIENPTFAYYLKYDN